MNEPLLYQKAVTEKKQKGQNYKVNILYAKKRSIKFILCIQYSMYSIQDEQRLQSV